MLVEPLRPRSERQATIQQFLDHRHAARHYVADQDDVGRGLQLSGVIALDQLDAERAELRAHRRVNVTIRARHPVPAGSRQSRDASHEGATYAKDVNVHGAALPTDGPA